MVIFKKVKIAKLKPIKEKGIKYTKNLKAFINCSYLNQSGLRRQFVKFFLYSNDVDFIKYEQKAIEDLYLFARKNETISFIGKTKKLGFSN